MLWEFLSMSVKLADVVESSPFVSTTSISFPINVFSDLLVETAPLLDEVNDFDPSVVS